MVCLRSPEVRFGRRRDQSGCPEGCLSGESPPWRQLEFPFFGQKVPTLTNAGLRGEHIHHGYWPTDESKARDSKEVAQISLIRLLLDLSQIPSGSKVLDVGCGIGGTSRYLASQLGCSVTGLTISTKQVEIAKRLTKAEASKETPEGETVATEDADGFLKLGKGKIRFIELDAEKMGDVFEGDSGTFDAVWISEALSHFPDKALFFQNAYKVLKTGGKLAVADWFKADALGQKEFDNDIKPIEGESLSAPQRAAFGAHSLLTYGHRWNAPTSSLHPSRIHPTRHRRRLGRVRAAQRYQ